MNAGSLVRAPTPGRRPAARLPAWTRRDLLATSLLARLAACGRAVTKGRRVVFPEAGYRALAGTTAEPWDAGGGAPDPDLQARAYEALLRATASRPWFLAVLPIVAAAAPAVDRRMAHAGWLRRRSNRSRGRARRGSPEGARRDRLRRPRSSPSRWAPEIP